MLILPLQYCPGTRSSAMSLIQIHAPWMGHGARSIKLLLTCPLSRQHSVQQAVDGADAPRADSPQ